MIKAVVFDSGGVLVNNVNTKKFWSNSKKSLKLRKNFGIGKISTKEFIGKGSVLLKMSKKDFFKKYKEAYDKITLHKEVFKIYKKINIDKYVLSDNNPIHTRYTKRDYKEIFEISKKTFLSQKIGMRKEKIKTFKYVIDKIKTNPKEVLMIDDEKSNLKNAKKIGIKTILYKNPKQLKKDLKKLGVEV